MGERKGPPLKNGRKTSIAIVAVMIAAIFVASAVPMALEGDNGDAVLGADTGVPITQTMSVSDIETAIQDAVDVAGDGDTITVTGTKTNADGPMTLNIPSDVRLIWTAVYIGEADTITGKTNMCIDLTGAGTFEVADGAEIEGTELKLIYIGAEEMLNIVVSGGSVTNTNTAVTFCIHSEGLGSFVMTGGTIRSSGSDNTGLGCAAVWFEFGELTVSGGTISVKSSLRFAIAVYTTDGDLAVSGGTISGKGERSRTIHALNGHTTVTGGKITSDGLESVAIIARGGLTMSGGEITADGEGAFCIRSPHLNVTMTGGAISASGKGCIGVFMGDNASVPVSDTVPVLAITGGSVKATGENSNVVSAHINGSLIVYLKSTISGDTNLARPANGIIAEVSTLDIPGSYDGTSNGITIVKGTLFALEDFVWTTAGETPILNIGGTYSVDWAGEGAPPHDPGEPGTSDDPGEPGGSGSNTALIAAIGVTVAAAVIAGGVLLFLRKP